MIRKYALIIAGAVLLTGLVALALNNKAVAQETPPEAALAPAIDVSSFFTYQGYLLQGGVAVNGSCDFEFRLYNALTAGTQVGPTQPANGQAVSAGRFTALLNFGPSAIDGQARWLQIAVRCPSGSGAFTTLSPRQVLTAAPYALSLRPGAAVNGNVSRTGIINLTNNSQSSGDIGLNVLSAPVGVQVDSASYIGVQVNSAGGAGVFVNSSGSNGFQVYSAGNDGVKVQSAAETGMQVDEAGYNGFQVDSAANNGLQVSSADNNGVQVDAAGAPSISYFSPSSDGLEVAGAEGFGLYIGRADIDGIRIRSAGDDGIQIGESGVFPTYGLYVEGPGTANTTLIPNTAVTNGQWALYTSDQIYASNIGIGAQTLVAVAAGDLSAGDAVSAVGLADPMPDSLNHLAQVRVADGTGGVVGVVESRMELQPAPGKDGLMILHSVAGPAKAGDYVSITVLGAAQVKTQAGKAIQPGQRVTVGANGAVRALQTRTIEGMVVSEGAPTIGVALQEPADGLVWVLVSPQ